MRMKKTASDLCLIAARAVITALFLCCVLFIWHNSMESAAASSVRSGKITEVVNGFLGRSGIEAVTEHFIRKVAHFSEYGMEGVLTVLLFMVYYLKPTKSWRIIILTGMLTALLDELIQFFSAGRSPGIGDICIDMAGFICGMLPVLAVWYLYRKSKEKRHCRADHD